MSKIEKLIRENIKKLKPYSSARDDFSGSASVFIDANENSLGSATSESFNRYPDPHHRVAKSKIAKIKNVDSDAIFLGNGSDEVIDLLFRIFCEPGKDSVTLLPPTYGMYKVSADINDVKTVEVPLNKDFSINVEKTLEASRNSKLLFICSPNNPSANSVNHSDAEKILNAFNGIVVIDEAYIDFSEEKTFVNKLDKYENLLIMQTFSKAWGLAGLRIGMAFSSPFIIDLMDRVKPPYNISSANLNYLNEALENLPKVKEMVTYLLDERARLVDWLSGISIVKKIHPSDANFLLVEIESASDVYLQLIAKGIVVRDRSRLIHCNDCLRISVGTRVENDALIEALKSL